MCSQLANNCWASSLLAWLFCQRMRPHRVRYMHLDLELRKDANWPPRPATVTYAAEQQSYANS